LTLKLRRPSRIVRESGVFNPLPTSPVAATGLCKDAADRASRLKLLFYSVLQPLKFSVVTRLICMHVHLTDTLLQFYSFLLYQYFVYTLYNIVFYCVFVYCATVKSSFLGFWKNKLHFKVPSYQLKNFQCSGSTLHIMCSRATSTKGY